MRNRAVQKAVQIACILFLLSFIPSAHAQAPTLYSWQDTLTNPLGQVIPNATVIVLSGTVGGAQAVNTTAQPGTPLATIYADPYGATPIVQSSAPLNTSSGNGTFQFWAAAGYYVVQAYGPGINGQAVYGIALGPSSTIAASKIIPGTNGQCLMTVASATAWSSSCASSVGNSSSGGILFGNAITTTPIVDTTPAELVYGIYIYPVVSTIGVGCSGATNSVTVTVTWTDPLGTTQTFVNNSISFTGNGTLGYTGALSPAFPAWAMAGTEISYSAASTLASSGCTTTPKYRVAVKSVY